MNLLNCQKKFQRNLIRELDVLLSSGEQVTCALLSGALIKLNVAAKSWLNWQIPIDYRGRSL